jgi:hypothetical protein
MHRTGVLDGSAVVELLDAEVREEVRRSGVDPLVDADAVRRFARVAVADHDRRSLSGVVRPVDDPDAVVDELVARVAGFGPLQRYLDDPRLPIGIRCDSSSSPVSFRQQQLWKSPPQRPGPLGRVPEWVV